VIAKAGPVLRAVAQTSAASGGTASSRSTALSDDLREALKVERKRRPTKPSAAAKKRRLEQKRRRGETKRLRRPPGDG
jgi:ribosome-associated protein